MKNNIQQGTFPDMRQFRYFLLSALLTIPSFLFAAAPELKDEHPQRYVVRQGDTLWDIAGRFLQHPWRWPELWQDNRDIADPNLIYPGDVLLLSYVDGQPRLTLERGAGGRSAGARRSSGPREVKLSPQIRREELTRAIPSIPIDAIQQFLTRPQVVTRQELDSAPYLTAFVREHIVGGAGDAIYVSAIEDDFIRGFDVVRPGKAYEDPDSGEILGYEALYVGDAELLRPGDPAKLMLTSTEIEALLDDRLFPDPEEEVLENFQPKAAPLFLEGKIISLLEGVNQIGQYSVVVLNKGSDDGLEPGDVLRIMQRTDPPKMGGSLFRRKTEMPLEQAGVLMVFRPFERVSYALVMYATRALHVGDSVRSPRE